MNEPNIETTGLLSLRIGRKSVRGDNVYNSINTRRSQGLYSNVGEFSGAGEC